MQATKPTMKSGMPGIIDSPSVPLRLCEVYPPQPDRAGAIQNGFVFHKSLVRIEGRGRSIQEVAVDIEKAWKRMAKLTRVSL